MTECQSSEMKEALCQHDMKRFTHLTSISIFNTSVWLERFLPAEGSRLYCPKLTLPHSLLPQINNGSSESNSVMHWPLGNTKYTGTLEQDSTDHSANVTHDKNQTEY